MSTGKYSPTVCHSYDRDQSWHTNHTSDPNSWYDRDGYDSYGYDAQGQDRAGYTEMEYLSDGRYVEAENRMVYALYESVYEDWAGTFIPRITV